MSRFLFLIILCSSILIHKESQAQKFLALRKAGSASIVKFYTGERIRFRLTGERDFNTALIKGFGYNTVKFHYYEIHVSEIVEIDTRGKSFSQFNFRGGAGKLIVAGIAFPLVDAFNRSVVQGQDFSISRKALPVTGGLIGAAVLLKLIEKKKFKLGRKYIIEVIEE
ncbi:MAG: hypothetical protein AAFX87_24580 [Bacteroidota bacterium]